MLVPENGQRGHPECGVHPRLIVGGVHRGGDGESRPGQPGRGLPPSQVSHHPDGDQQSPRGPREGIGLVRGRAHQLHGQDHSRQDHEDGRGGFDGVLHGSPWIGANGCHVRPSTSVTAQGRQWTFVYS